MSRQIEAHDRSTLARRLAGEVEAVLSAALEARGAASLAVPGGTTPAAFLTELGLSEIDWANVRVTLTDERCVAPDHPRSNRRLLDETLFSGTARQARFVALDDALGLAAMCPLDACIVGMGEDLHTASLFPGADRLVEALSETCNVPALRITAPGASEDRITLTAPVLNGALNKFILLHGPEKRAALLRAQAPGTVAEAPVRVVLNGPHPASIFWAP